MTRARHLCTAFMAAAFASLGISVLLPSTPAPAAIIEVESEDIKRSVWSVGLTGNRHTWKAGDGNEILGNSAAVALGGGYIEEEWYVNLSLDIILGPYEPTRNRQLNVDYQGTGLTIWWGYSAQTLDLRSAEGGYGFALGLGYADTVGRSFGKNRRESKDANDPENAELIESYVMRVTNFSLLPAIFFSWLSPGRKHGNAPELLMTRVEGYVLTLGMAMPLLATYKAEYSTKAGGENTSESGRLRGYQMLVSLTAMLGT